MRPIDADKLYYWIWIKSACNLYGKPTLDSETSCKILDMVNASATMDAVPVVRCRECAKAVPVGDRFRCNVVRGFRKPDFYCASGRRKDDFPVEPERFCQMERSGSQYGCGTYAKQNVEAQLVIRL